MECGLKRDSHLWNERTRSFVAHARVNTWSYITCKNYWNFAKHVASLPAHRWVQRLLSWHPFGARRVGRPRNTSDSKLDAYSRYGSSSFCSSSFCSVLCSSRGPGVMPLSKGMDLLKDGNTPIQFAKDNPKKVGSKTWDRYEQYKDATSIAQATEKKAGWQDLTADFEKGFLKIMMDIDGEGQGSTKRPAPEGTPDREAQARTKTHASEMIPRSLPTELQDPISKVEMSAAAIAALRRVVREEITNGMSAMENRITNKMDEQIGKMQQDMEEEKKARKSTSPLQLSAASEKNRGGSRRVVARIACSCRWIS